MQIRAKSGWLVLCLFMATLVSGQFAPPVGQPGTTAMYKDSSAFVDWANACQVIRGYQDISNPSAGYASVGDSSMALGIAGSNGVVSLGDGGIAIVQFASAIKDDTGYDLAVFENSFDDNFLELGYVEVSSDGIHFFRFPAISNTDTTTQTASFGYTDATKINNLAGKYRGMYGTPFDLAEIADSPLLDKQHVTHVKVIDVVGSIQPAYGTRDSQDHLVNDPWPTAFPSGGFDLDAVGVIHHQAPLGVEEHPLALQSVYPNPFSNALSLQMQSYAGNLECTLSTVQGRVVLKQAITAQHTTFDTADLPPGVYILNLRSKEGSAQRKLIKY